mmetsp:Transcript_37602/g.101956  ORF Transcript_37602/g.101956 Transcript_37602/m.101956 type:complete len:181 (+) Transcript_37602:166-708(+)
MASLIRSFSRATTPAFRGMSTLVEEVSRQSSVRGLDAEVFLSERRAEAKDSAGLAYNAADGLPKTQLQLTQYVATMEKYIQARRAEQGPDLDMAAQPEIIEAREPIMDLDLAAQPYIIEATGPAMDLGPDLDMAAQPSLVRELRSAPTVTQDNRVRSATPKSWEGVPDLDLAANPALTQV